MNGVEAAKQRIAEIIAKQMERIEKITQNHTPTPYAEMHPLQIGIIGGDGIGPSITAEAERILRFLLEPEVASGKITFQHIQGLTIEHRLATAQAIPDQVLSEIKACPVLLKGPTTTPEKGSSTVNIESANVAMRKELDLFSNIRPVKVPEQQIDWTFFRENTEDSYAVGNMGIEINDQLAIDFKITTTPGVERIARAAFEYAKNHGKRRVTVVTKANVIKTTDGKFLEICSEMSKEYPNIQFDSWYIDIMTAKLLDEKRRSEFEVLILPNLYGDILTDEAAEIQGGVGTAGSANIGTHYAMFEAIHGSAPRMVTEGRAQYADPSSMIRAAAMLLAHIGYIKQSEKLEAALSICTAPNAALKMTGHSDGATGAQFADYIMDTIMQL